MSKYILKQKSPSNIFSNYVEKDKKKHDPIRKLMQFLSFRKKSKDTQIGNARIFFQIFV